MPDEKKPAAAKAPPAPRPLSAELVLEELGHAMAPPLPAVEVADGGLVRLTYEPAELHAARCSADVEALRALPGHDLVAAEQVDVRDGHGAPLRGHAIELRLAPKRA